MKTVLILGANGQLGQCIQEAAKNEDQIDWIFTSSDEVDITSTFDVQQCFSSKRIDFCINCAAYTNVEKAEEEEEKAFLINAEALKNLAEICNKHQTVLFHFSTDYVFEGSAQMPYLETDSTNPINVYGKSKLQGEKNISRLTNYYFIFRTSWLYSRYGHNFFNTILRKAKQGEVLNITAAQTGTPTNAHHLAQLVVKLIRDNNASYGIYHYSNSGQTSWFGFAKEILKISDMLDTVTLNQDNSYKTKAARPEYSVLDKQKVESVLQVSPVSWQEGLKELYQSTIPVE